MHTELEAVMKHGESWRPNVLLLLFVGLMAAMAAMTVFGWGHDGSWMAVAVANSCALWLHARQQKASVELAKRLAELERKLTEKDC